MISLTAATIVTATDLAWDLDEPTPLPPVPDCSAVVRLTESRRCQIEARFHVVETRHPDAYRNRDHCNTDDWWLEPVRAVELDRDGDVMGELDLAWTVEWLAIDGRWAEVETALLANRLRRIEG